MTGTVHGPFLSLTGTQGKLMAHLQAAAHGRDRSTELLHLPGPNLIRAEWKNGMDKLEHVIAVARSAHLCPDPSTKQLDQLTQIYQTIAFNLLWLLWQLWQATWYGGRGALLQQEVIVTMASVKRLAHIRTVLILTQFSAFLL